MPAELHDTIVVFLTSINTQCFLLSVIAYGFDLILVKITDKAISMMYCDKHTTNCPKSYKSQITGDMNIKNFITHEVMHDCSLYNHEML